MLSFPSFCNSVIAFIICFFIVLIVMEMKMNRMTLQRPSHQRMKTVTKKWARCWGKKFWPSPPPLEAGASCPLHDHRDLRLSCKTIHLSSRCCPANNSGRPIGATDLQICNSFQRLPPVDGEESGEPGSSRIGVSNRGGTSISSSSIFISRGQDWGRLGKVC